MTDNLKKTLVILLDTYKEDKIDKEDILTILETILDNNCSCGTNVPKEIGGMIYHNGQQHAQQQGISKILNKAVQIMSTLKVMYNGR